MSQVLFSKKLNEKFSKKYQYDTKVVWLLDLTMFAPITFDTNVQTIITVICMVSQVLIGGSEARTGIIL